MTYKNIAVTKSVNEMINKLVDEHKRSKPEERPLTKGSLVSELVVKEYKKKFNRK